MRLSRQFALVVLALAVLALWLPWRMAAFRAMLGDGGAWQLAWVLSAVAVALVATAGWLLATQVVRPLEDLTHGLERLAQGFEPPGVRLRGTQDLREMLRLLPDLTSRLVQASAVQAELQDLRAQLRQQDVERVQHIQQVREAIGASPQGIALRTAGWQLDNPRWTSSPGARCAASLRGADGEDVEVWIDSPRSGAGGAGDASDAGPRLQEIARLAQALLATPLDLEQRSRVDEILAAAAASDAQVPA